MMGGGGCKTSFASAAVPELDATLVEGALTDVMSWMELRRLSFLLSELSRMKYFCACEATCVGVLEMTKFREMLRQSPFPNLAKPRRNRRCSSSVQGIPFRRSWSEVFAAGALACFLLGGAEGAGAAGAGADEPKVSFS